MSEYTINDILYTLCYTQLLEIRSNLKKRAKYQFTREQCEAQKKIIRSLFELAAGAAMSNRMRWTTTDALVALVREVEDIMEWNMSRGKYN